MENSSKKSGKETAEESTNPMNAVSESETTENKKRSQPKISRAHDFAHTHPSHAKHKTFGMDHEPGAF